MYAKKILKLKDIAFFKPSTFNCNNHTSQNGITRNNINHNHNHRQFSSENRENVYQSQSYAQSYLNLHSQSQCHSKDKKSLMLFPTVTERVNTAENILQSSSQKHRQSSSPSLSNHKQRKNSTQKEATKDLIIDNHYSKSNTHFYTDHNYQSTSTANNDLLHNSHPGHLYQEISKELKNNAKHSKGISNMSYDVYMKPNNNKKKRNNRNNNIDKHHVVLLKQNNPSSLKSTSASKESNTCNNSIKMKQNNSSHLLRKNALSNSNAYSSSNNTNTNTNSNYYNNVEEINTPEELHYFYVTTLQNGKIAENKF